MKYFCCDTALNEEYTLINLMQQFPKYTSVFEGTEDEKIWDAAPWLFELNNNPYNLKGQPLIQMDHCIVFETKEPIKNILDYLQSKIYIKENGQNRFFRIWDARVLLKHIPQWSAAQIQDFFSVFTCFYTESAEEGLLDKWQWNGGNKIHCIKILKSEALPHIKSEEELDREFEEGKASTKKEEGNLPIKEENTDPEIEKKNEEKPGRRKFFMD